MDIVDGEEGAELHATLADLHKRAGDVEAALREYERLSQSKAVRPGELCICVGNLSHSSSSCPNRSATDGASGWV